MPKIRFTSRKDYIDGKASNLFDVETLEDGQYVNACELCCSPFVVSDSCALNVIGTDATDWVARIEIPNIGPITYPGGPVQLLDGIKSLDVPEGPIIVDPGFYDWKPTTNPKYRPQPFSNNNHLDGSEVEGILTVPLVFDYKPPGQSRAPANLNGACVAQKVISTSSVLGGWTGTYNEAPPAGTIEPHYRQVEMEERITTQVVGWVLRQADPVKYMIVAGATVLHYMYMKTAKWLPEQQFVVGGTETVGGVSGIPISYDIGDGVWRTPNGQIPTGYWVPPLPSDYTFPNLGVESGAAFSTTDASQWITNGVYQYSLNWNIGGTTNAYIIPGSP